jgi:glycosyltransferase involved in cell wall biosynthesis
VRGCTRAGGESGLLLRARPEAAAAALATIAPEDRLVVFVGKLIASKGVDLLLAAWPLVLERVPDAKLVIVGFGAFREGLEALAGDLASGRDLRGENGLDLQYLRAFLERRRTATRRAPSGSCGRGGSTTPSSPTCCPPPRRWSCPARSPRRSGWSPPRPRRAARCPCRAPLGPGGGREHALRGGAGGRAAAAGLRARADAVPELAAAVAGWLEAPEALRTSTREAMVAVTRERYSWDGVARTVLAAAEGRLEGLPAP